MSSQSLLLNALICSRASLTISSVFWTSVRIAVTSYSFFPIRTGESGRTPCCAQVGATVEEERAKPRRLQRQPTRAFTIPVISARRVASHEDILRAPQACGYREAPPSSSHSSRDWASVEIACAFKRAASLGWSDLRVHFPETRNPPFPAGFFGGASRARTGDLLGAIQALSQLSYSPGERGLYRAAWRVLARATCYPNASASRS